MLAEGREQTAGRRPAKRRALAAEHVVGKLAGDFESFKHEVDQSTIDKRDFEISYSPNPYMS